MNHGFYYNKVKEFNDAFDNDPSDFDLRVKLVKEEWIEMLKEACDLIVVQCGLVESCLHINPSDKEALESLSTTVNSLEDFFGEEVIQEAFMLVHESNMSKLSDDGQPIRREDGKIMKGPNYTPPDLDHMWERAFSINQND